MSKGIIFLKRAISKVRSMKSSYNLYQRFYVMAFIFLLPCVAQAQSSGGSDEVVTIVYNICNYLSGTLARAIGVLVIIFLGYKTLRGQLDWRHAGSIAVGMGLILGGAYYGTLLFGGS